VAEEQIRNIPKWIESAKNFKLGEDFGSSDETVLTRVFSTPVMVYNWPSKIKAFYMKEVEGDPNYVKGVDLLAPDGFGEIIGGSERETDIDILIRKIKEHDLDQNDFEWYLDLRRFGSVPHAGFGLGLERLVRWACDIHHVRETIPFPRRYGHIKP
jgi:asparaginyl-tRNA synthetase